MREALGHLDRAIMSNDESDTAEFDLRMIEVGSQSLRVAVKRGPKGRPPFLLFNGIGANLELAKPFLRALKRTEAIIFDVPGVGGSPAPPYPYRLSSIARLAARLLTKLGHKRADIGGVSWAAGLRSSSPISTTICAESSCWRRRRRGRSWCLATLGCCGKWRRRGVTSTRASCAVSLP